MNLTPAVELRDVTKDFAVGVRNVRLRALDHLTLTIEQGGIFGLLGPNGCGKSTTIKIILGFVAPTSGTCAILGQSSQHAEARALVGYLPESPDFYRYLTGRELVTFYGQLCGIRSGRMKQRVAEVIEHVGLTTAADRRVGSYSKGMLQRIGLAQAIVHEPKLLILDEPTAGVDPVAAAAIARLLLHLKAQGTTIVITSHLLGQLEDLCDRIAILDHGRLIVEEPVAELRRETAPPKLEVAALPESEREELDGWLAARGRAPAVAKPTRARLEDVFLERLAGTSSR